MSPRRWAARARGHPARGPLQALRRSIVASRQSTTCPKRAMLGGILLTFVVVILGILGTISTYRELKRFASTELPLDRLSGQIVHLDEVLTMSARMFAVTGEPRWEE